MKKLIVSVLMLFNLEAVAKETGWFCEEESGKRDGSAIWSCGVGQAKSEQEARADALLNALAEFSTICKYSTDCAGHHSIVEPKRLTCKEIAPNVWKCYRLIIIHIQEEK